MAKTVRGVMTSVCKDKQITGMTAEEIRKEFMLAGYGLTKAEKRTKELIVSAQLQSDGRTNERGQTLFFYIFWPWSWKTIKLDDKRIGAIEYTDPRHTILRRLDGRENVWLLE